jgi:hypothetical protein
MPRMSVHDLERWVERAVTVATAGRTGTGAAENTAFPAIDPSEPGTKARSRRFGTVIAVVLVG